MILSYSFTFLEALWKKCWDVFFHFNILVYLFLHKKTNIIFFFLERINFRKEWFEHVENVKSPCNGTLLELYRAIECDSYASASGFAFVYPGLWYIHNITPFCCHISRKSILLVLLWYFQHDDNMDRKNILVFSSNYIITTRTMVRSEWI